MPLTSPAEKRNIYIFIFRRHLSVRHHAAFFRRLDTEPMPPFLTALLTSRPIPASWLNSALQLPFLLVVFYGDADKKGDIFNILWALVFGFATLNILGLVARRFEPSRNRLNFGETVAIMVVIVSIVLLGWEMLNLFKIFPIKLQRHD